jgi:hypothetical protein
MTLKVLPNSMSMSPAAAMEASSSSVPTRRTSNGSCTEPMFSVICASCWLNRSKRNPATFTGALARSWVAKSRTAVPAVRRPKGDLMRETPWRRSRRGRPSPVKVTANLLTPVMDSLSSIVAFS